VPVMPSLIIAPIREEFIASLPQRVSTHPLGCHRRRIPDAVVFDKLIEVLVSGMGLRASRGHDLLGDHLAQAPG
jgi:hypothetical protein